MPLAPDILELVFVPSPVQMAQPLQRIKSAVQPEKLNHILDRLYSTIRSRGSIVVVHVL